MRKTIITCDRCGKKISGNAYLSHVNITLRYWHGGSMGGKEDEDNIAFDLCEDCARELSYKMQDWLKNKNENSV